MTEQTKSGSEKFCVDCGTAISINAAICPKCGARQPRRGGKNKTVAALLALLLGGIGVHKFYLGKIGQGIMYLIFCWAFIPWIIGIIEGIILFSLTDEEFHKKYT